MTQANIQAQASGQFTLGGQIPVTRLGFGAMRITGPGIWGAPRDESEAIAVLRRAVELGVDFIDTADSYGPFVSEDLIRKALHPYDGVTIATKGGLVRTGPDEWHPVGRPEYLRQCVEMSLRRLGIDTIPLYQLHRIDPQVPLADQIGVLDDMRNEGKIALIGLSEVSVDEIVQARLLAPIVSVQNLYNVVNRQSEDVLDYATKEGLGFIPWFPVATGQLARPGGPLARIASAAGATPAQLALAWLLRRSPVMLPIPGTGSVTHLEENVAAASVDLTDEQYEEMSGLAA
ncbi:MAG: aldo/keto reductase [Actinomycetota bacterium]|nr:aldo/keto reductase [Actinomycetota bacterium]